MKNLPLGDAGGVACAAFCAVHCLVTPVLLGALAGFAWLEGLDVYFLACSAFTALLATFSNRRSKFIVGIWVGVLGLTVALFLEERWTYAPYLLHIAALFLITAHYLNMKQKIACAKNQ